MVILIKIVTIGLIILISMPIVHYFDNKLDKKYRNKFTAAVFLILLFIIAAAIFFCCRYDS